MPYASPTTIASVNTTLLTGTYDQKLKMLRKTPICPPDGYNAMDVDAGKAAQDEPADPRDKKFTKLRITKLEDMVGFIKLIPAGAIEFVGAITFDIKLASELKTTASRAGRIPCWFLPWVSGHIFKLKIVDVATNGGMLDFTAGAGIDRMPNPSLFFTAGINGCSVFSIGSRKGPSVYHGGLTVGSGLTMPLEDGETTEAAWKRMVGRTHSANKRVRSVGKTDYVSQLKPGATDNSDRYKTKFGPAMVPTTNRAIQLEQELLSRGTMTLHTVSPWGAVFGLRSPAGDWQMDLVKNATVSYHRIESIVKKRFLRSDKVTQVERGEMRADPGNIPKDAEGFVDYSRMDTVDNNEQAISKAVNLGYKEFFPGSHSVHYKTLRSRLLS